MSTIDRESQSPSFERLRSLAKQLTRDCRSGDVSALRRIQTRLPRLAQLDAASAAPRVRLADAQHALAREAGVGNWAALRSLVIAQEPLSAKLARFFRALESGDRTTLVWVAERFPEVAHTSLHAACAACDAAAVERWLARNPSLATAKHAGSSWRPLDCLAASPLFELDGARRAASVTIGERLLAAGADPDTATAVPAEPARRLSALARASEWGNTRLVKLLLERGANPNDGESVCRAAERNHRDVLELLVGAGAEISARQAWRDHTVLHYLAGFPEDSARAKKGTEGMRWLLEQGASPNVGSGEHDEAPLHRVAETGRSAAVAELLLAHGADPRAERADGRTPYELAMRAGNVAVADLLRARAGTPPRLRPADAFLAACATGDEAGARAIAAANPKLLETVMRKERGAMLRVLESGNAATVQVMAALGLNLGAEAAEGGTALHHAAWLGRVELVRALLAAGASVDVRDKTLGSSPIAWAAHGSANCRDADEDYAAVIDLLLAAKPDRAASINRGNEPPERLASDGIADHLRARGFAPEAAPE